MSSYEKFIEANNSLKECFEGQSPKKFEGMTPHDQEGVCKDQVSAVRDFLTGDNLTFRKLVQERIDILDKQASSE